MIQLLLRRRQKGIALLQVLLLSMIISLLLMQLVYTARGQISVAREIEQRVRADLLIHSARSEALFLSIATPGSFNANALSLVSSRGQRISEKGSGLEVATHLQDVSGLLPLRFPDHPLWPDTLISLGMEPVDVERFLNEMRHMQDSDTQSFDFSEEPRVSSAGFAYPNMPFQLPNSLHTWVQLDADIRSRVDAISHHYMQASVNFFATPDVVSNVILSGYGAQIKEERNVSDSNLELRRHLETKFPDWVGVSSSGLWRLEVSVRGDEISRRDRVDFRVSMRDTEPFTIVGQ